MQKYCSLTAFNIQYIRIHNCALLPIIIISHRSINFEQKYRRVVSLSVDELSQKICRRIVLSTSCLYTYISCLLFTSIGSPMYKSLTKTKKYSELEAHETLKTVASANAIIKYYNSSSLITVKRHAMVLSFFKS